MANWEDGVRKVVPYVPGEQPKIQNLIKLNTNENPYPPCPGVIKAIEELEHNIDSLKRYPKPGCDNLVEELSKYYGIDEDRIFVGVGSDDVLSVAFLTFFNSGKPILFPDITYSFYDVWADVYKIPYETIPLNDDFEINFEDYYKENGGIVIANPNAPTGIAKSAKEIEELVCRNRDSVVIVDEAYVDFGAQSVLPLIDKYDNLLVVRTYSKSRSMAGLRIGMAFGSKQMIKYMSDVKYSINSYTMNTPALNIGCESLKDEEYFRSRLDMVIKTREWTTQKLRENGFKVLDSSTNFVFASPLNMSAEEVYNKLRAKGILVRFWNKPRIKDFLRISIGTDEEMAKLIETIKEI